MAFFNTKERRYIPQPIPPTPPYNPPVPPTPPEPAEGSTPNIPRPDFTPGSTIIFYKCADENNKLNKTFTNALSFTGVFKEDVAIINPEIDIEVSNDLTAYNYIFMNGRYYRITNCILQTGGIYHIMAYIDVLSTYKEGIKSIRCIVDRNTVDAYINRFLPDNELVNDIRCFYEEKFIDPPADIAGDDDKLKYNTFRDTPEFILHTAGPKMWIEYGGVGGNTDE